MYCPRCGTVNGDGATACSACSTRLQPGIFKGGPAVPTVSNYLVTSIMTTLCCCLPAGIASIVYSVQANGKLEVGDYLGAQDKAKQACMWAWIAFGLGLAMWLFQIVVGALAG